MFQLKIELYIGMFITYSAVLCYESALHIMGMLLGFDSYIYQMCSYLVQAIFAVFLQEHASSHCSLL